MTDDSVNKLTKKEMIQICRQFQLLTDGTAKILILRLKYKRDMLLKAADPKPDKDRETLTTQEQIDFYDKHSKIDIHYLLRKYGIQAKGKKAKLVKRFLKGKHTVTQDEEDIMEQHGQQLLFYCKDLGLDIKKSRKPSQLSLARKLQRVREMNLRIHEKLVQRMAMAAAVAKDKKGDDGGGGNGEPLHIQLPPELDMTNVTDWKEQVYFFHCKGKIRKLFEQVDLPWKGGKTKRVPMLRQICRHLKIKLPTTADGLNLK